MNIVEELARLQALDELTKEAGLVSFVKSFASKMRNFTKPKSIEVKPSTTSTSTPSKQPPSSAGNTEHTPTAAQKQKEDVVQKPTQQPKPTENPTATPKQPESPKQPEIEAKPFSEKAREWWAKDTNKVGVMSGGGGLVAGIGIGAASSGGSRQNMSSHY